MRGQHHIHFKKGLFISLKSKRQSSRQSPLSTMHVSFLICKWQSNRSSNSVANDWLLLVSSQCLHFRNEDLSTKTSCYCISLSLPFSSACQKLFPRPLGCKTWSKPRARNSTEDGQAGSSTMKNLNKLLTSCITHLLNGKWKCVSQNSLLLRNANTLKHFENIRRQMNVYY